MVPPKFRKDAPPGCNLHKANLDREDIEEREGFRVTTPLRTLLDAAAGDISQEQLEKAVSDALSRGLVRRRKLVEAMARLPQTRRLGMALGLEEIAAS